MLKTFRFITSAIAMITIAQWINNAFDLTGWNAIAAMIGLPLIVLAVVFAPFDETDF